MKIKLFLVALACSIFIGAGIGAGLVVTNHPEGDFNHESKEFNHNLSWQFESKEFIFNCYLYAGFRIDEIEWEIEKGLKELLEPSASEGQIGGLRRVITDHDIIVEMAEWDALYTNPEWEVPSTAYAYRVMVQLKEVYKLEEVINLLYDWTEDTTEKYVWKVEWRAVGKNGDRFRTEDWERWTQGTPIEAVEKVTW